MKKILTLLLTLCMLFPLLGCISEPVAFSTRINDGVECFVDVVELIPVNFSAYDNTLSVTVASRTRTNTLKQCSE